MEGSSVLPEKQNPQAVLSSTSFCLQGIIAWRSSMHASKQANKWTQELEACRLWQSYDWSIEHRSQNCNDHISYCTIVCCNVTNFVPDHASPALFPHTRQHSLSTCCNIQKIPYYMLRRQTLRASNDNDWWWSSQNIILHRSHERTLYTSSYEESFNWDSFMSSPRLSGATDSQTSCIGWLLYLLFRSSALRARLPCQPGFKTLCSALCICFATAWLSDQFLMALLTYLVMIVVTGRAPSTG